MRMQGKTILLTGAAQGIGASTAHLLCQQGAAAIILLDRNALTLNQLVNELKEKYPALHCMACIADIADRQKLLDALTPLLQQVKLVNILINNAGIAPSNTIDQTDIWHQVINVNVHGTYYVTQTSMDYIPDGGRIINVSSVLGRAGTVVNTAYCTTKHALLGFTKSLALDLAPRQITVNAVLPGWVNTPLFHHEMALKAERNGLPVEQIRRNTIKQAPMRRLVESNEVASMICFLASDDASAITAQSYVVDGGNLCGL
jgi:ketoreductase